MDCSLVEVLVSPAYCLIEAAAPGWGLPVIVGWLSAAGGLIACCWTK